MVFDIEGKVALVTGGAAGLGLSFIKELLKHGLRGATIADVNEELANKALQEIELEFGKNKAIFIKTDISIKGEFENAFKQTINHFNNLDILINNAGILNEGNWERAIAINFNGTVHGTLLGLEEYIPKYRTGSEGVIVNISSNGGVNPLPAIPIYTGTKFAVLGMSKAFGDEAHYERTKVRVIVLCPGGTDTALNTALSPESFISEPYWNMFQPALEAKLQSVDVVASGLIQLIQSAKSGSAWVVEYGKGPYEFVLPPRESFAPK